MPTALLGPIIGAGISGVAGAAANRSSTVSSTPNIDPRYLDLRNTLLNTVEGDIRDPTKALPAQLKTLAKSKVNRRAADSQSNLMARLAANGFGMGNGQTPLKAVGVELNRQRELGDVETNYDNMILNRDTSQRELAARLIGTGTGQTQVSSGNPLGGALDSGASTLTTLMTLDKLLKSAK